MQKIPMTKQGAEQLQAELDRLKKVDRREIIEAIAEARAHGDLKENAEYHAAKEKQSFIEGRIAEIEGKIANAQVIDISAMPNSGKAVFGATVDLINEDTGEKVVYQIVGEDEADLKDGKISVTSPIARAIIGKQEGDVIDVTTPAGVVAYEIEKVAYV
ncbi:MAG: transcription elongation factor GreA [Legionellales bacterium]|nr:transcription elongation factor GreA [Legionellales bacterium]|tara:strand:+ start:12642 stop:13118 length:477 start_codon:yes stop_codon:yes gene_type:complete